MPKQRLFFKYWLPVMIWMLVIFSASKDSHSFQRSSRIIRPLLHWLFPNMPEAKMDHVVTVARKGAHLTEYAVLAILFWRAVRRPAKSDPRPWNWPLAGCTVLFVALYAATDEFHQRLVPGRQASPWDVLLDTCGAVVGVFILWKFWSWRRRKAASLESLKREAADV